MQLRGEVDKLEQCGDCVRVTLVNVRAKNEADWARRAHEVSICVSHAQSRAYHIGRVVTLKMEPVAA